jgi:hypothetical protein
MIASEVRYGGLRFGSKTLVGHVPRDLALADNHLRLADWIVRSERDVTSVAATIPIKVFGGAGPSECMDKTTY